MDEKRVVHIVDDEDSIRRSTGFMLKKSGFSVTPWASGVEFLKNLKHAEQGCILLDVRMPEMDGLEVQQELNARGISMPVVVLTGHGDVTIAVRAMKAGAVDFLEKPVDDHVLIDVLLNAIRVDRERHVVASERTATLTRVERLTAREREVFGFLAKGLQNRDIAQRLGISPRTVEVYKARIMEKLQCRNIADAVKLSLELSADSAHEH